MFQNIAHFSGHFFGPLLEEEGGGLYASRSLGQDLVAFVPVILSMQLRECLVEIDVLFIHLDIYSLYIFTKIRIIGTTQLVSIGTTQSLMMSQS